MSAQSDLTVIYYTSGRENPTFEAGIQQRLLETIGDLPLISVSQTPLEFGRNICVGAREASSQNAYRQLQVGAMAATTRFVCTAEADMLYPRAYFEFVPPKDDVAYLAEPLYVAFAQRGYGRYFCRKPRGSESAMMIGRACLIHGIERMLEGCGQWGALHANGDSFPYLLRLIPRDHFPVADGVVTFKTDQNMHRKTPHDVNSRTRSLPGWGEVHALWKRCCAAGVPGGKP